MRRQALVWVGSLLAVAAISAGLTAQAVQPRPPDEVRVLSGSDVGFRVEGRQRARRTDRRTGRTNTIDVLTGTLVVRVDGQWIEAEISGAGVHPATN
jgi:hypothetical protein